MYNVDHWQDNHCLDNDVDFESIWQKQFISYCFRPSPQSTRISHTNFTNIDGRYFTFKMLREQNITSDQLLQWSATIDIAERYQIYIERMEDFGSFEEDRFFFHNCSWPWFGPFCRFSFDFFLDMSFGDFVLAIFRNKPLIINGSMMTCYLHLQCETSTICLDWRDICDRKMDCPNGADESDCWSLEMNECTTEEFRCHNGQCIPKGFLSDDDTYSDCLDRSDERLTRDLQHLCFQDPSFLCEERTCRPGSKEFSCGDGQCIEEMERTCFNGKGNLLSYESCLGIMDCLMKISNNLYDEWCDQLCLDTNCILNHCPPVFEFPPEPILFGHVRLIFESEKVTDEMFLPSYVCYNEELCKDFLPTTVYLNNFTCRHIDQLGLSEMNKYRHFEVLVRHIKSIFRACAVVPNGVYDCNHTNAYQCKNSSKCISKHRLVDGIEDCPFQDDETYNESCVLNDRHHRFRCLNDENRCFAHLIIENDYYDCPERDDEGPTILFFKTHHILFSTICDGYEELIPVAIGARNETDETECEYWPCNNTYNRCDGVWACYNGADEINCEDSTCPPLHHMCIFPSHPNQIQCLPINRAGDGTIDCLGASDERQHCRTLHPHNRNLHIYCWNDTKCIDTFNLCDGISDCKFADDEKVCMNDTRPLQLSVCYKPTTDIEKFLCGMPGHAGGKMIYFTLQNMPIYPPSLTNNATERFSVHTQSPSTKSTSDTDVRDDWSLRCNRGLEIRVRMTDNENGSQECLCPPSYYGDTCQYQNQRVSVSLQLRVSSDWNTLFTILIILIDHEGKIHSHDRIQYLPFRDCEDKYHVYLLYSTRPKDNAKNYSVRIDAFNKLTLNYRASWIFPVLFPFLPVYPLAIQLTVPILPVQPTTHCPLPCVHGQCIKYTNTENRFFCQCDRGWSGIQCSIAHRCDCALDSLCIDQSICLCPVGKFGPLCYLKQHSCDLNQCLNNGRCVPDDIRQEMAEGLRFSYACICPQGYHGFLCQLRDTRIDISFANNFAIPESLFIHFIAAEDSIPHVQTTILKRISLDQSGLTIYTSIVFNVAFVQFQNNYYLIILRESPIHTVDISIQITHSHRCASVHELFDTTIANRHLLRRIKYYHVPCQHRHALTCFYDEVHLCLCDLSRHANCFELNFNITHDCFGLNPCENGGQCFQDDSKCPTSVICACDTCFYGTRCQFSTKGFRVSLDAILGYQIRPNVALSQQSIAVKVSIALTITISILGLINGLLLILTFRRKVTRNIGCDIYLFMSSIISIINMNAFFLKTCFLLVSQMGLVTNRLFILSQCRSVDFAVRTLLGIGDWLHACVAIERMLIISKGVTFDKAKSKQAAKWITIVVLIFVTCTNIQETMHHYLMDIEEEQRTWCVIRYPPSVQMFDSIVNLFHFFLPFSINVISALVIITVTARTRSNVQKKQTHKEHLHEQLRNHKHLLISPCILVLLASPRLVISFLSGCMKSVRDPWLFLSGYFVSFIPSVVTFPIFVLPSQMYRKQFFQSIKSLRCQW